MDTNKKKILEALENCQGIVTTACKSANMPRSTYYLWLKEDEEFAESVAEIQEVALDFVESKLMEKINGIKVQVGENVYDNPPSDTAIIFYLKTKGKKRGYIERQEIAVGDMNIPLMSFDPLAQTDEENKN